MKYFKETLLVIGLFVSLAMTAHAMQDLKSVRPAVYRLVMQQQGK